VWAEGVCSLAPVATAARTASATSSAAYAVSSISDWRRSRNEPSESAASVTPAVVPQVSRRRTTRDATPNTTRKASGGASAVPLLTKSLSIWFRLPCPPYWCGHRATMDTKAPMNEKATTTGAAFVSQRVVRTRPLS